VILPAAEALGIPPIQLGSVVILNLMIGLLTPPVGLVLYVLSSVTDIPFTRVAQGTAPFLIPLIVILALVTFVPALTTWLPGVFGLEWSGVHSSRPFVSWHPLRFVHAAQA